MLAGSKSGVIRGRAIKSAGMKCVGIVGFSKRRKGDFKNEWPQKNGSVQNTEPWVKMMGCLPLNHLVTFPTSGREEAVIHFQHKGGEASAVVRGHLGASLELSANSLDLSDTAYVFIGAVGILVIEDLVTEYLVVECPVATTTVDHRLGVIVVAVEVGIGGVPIKLCIFLDVFSPLANDGVMAFAKHLEGEHTATSHGPSGVSM